MNYTKNYHLPQWVKEDRIMMDDFNQMCADMEAGLNKNASAAATAKSRGDKGVTDAAAAKTAAQSAQSAADAAQAAAEAAQSSANAAQATADAAYCAGNPPYAVGFYTGTGEELRIQLGFQPNFLIISAQEGADDPGGSVGKVLLGGERVCQGRASFTQTGFTVRLSSYYPKVNIPGVRYEYIAFR